MIVPHDFWETAWTANRAIRGTEPAWIELPVRQLTPDELFDRYSWHDISGDAAPGAQRSTQRPFELLDAQRECGFPAEQTLLLGFSQECLITIEAGLRHLHLVRRIGRHQRPCASTRSAATWNTSGTGAERLLLAHGKFNPLIPIAPMRRQVQFLQQARVALRVVWVREGAFNRGRAELTVIRVFVEMLATNRG